MLWDVYALIAVQLEADTENEAKAEAAKLPIEYWDEDSFDIQQAIGHAD